MNLKKLWTCRAIRSRLGSAFSILSSIFSDSPLGRMVYSFSLVSAIMVGEGQAIDAFVSILKKKKGSLRLYAYIENFLENITLFRRMSSHLIVLQYFGCFRSSVVGSESPLGN